MARVTTHSTTRLRSIAAENCYCKDFIAWVYDSFFKVVVVVVVESSTNYRRLAASLCTQTNLMAAYTRTMGFRQWACRLCVTVLVTLLGLSRALEDQYTGIRNSMGYQDSRSWSGSLMKTAEIKGGKELNSTRVNVLAGRVKVGIVHNSSKDTHPSPKEDLAMLISGGASYGRQLEDRTVQTPMAHISEPPSEHRGDLVGVLQRCLKQAGKSGLPGAAAGVLQVLMFMWLRTVVNYQCRYGTSIFAAVAELYRQGGILRFYRGVSFALVANPLSRFGMAAANEGALALRDALPHSLSLTVSTWIASLFAGLWRVILTPLDTCKTVLQVEGQKGFRQLMKKVMVTCRLAKRVWVSKRWYPRICIYHA